MTTFSLSLVIDRFRSFTVPYRVRVGSVRSSQSNKSNRTTQHVLVRSIEDRLRRSQSKGKEANPNRGNKKGRNSKFEQTNGSCSALRCCCFVHDTRKIFLYCSLSCTSTSCTSRSYHNIILYNNTTTTPWDARRAHPNNIPRQKEERSRPPPPSWVELSRTLPSTSCLRKKCSKNNNNNNSNNLHTHSRPYRIILPLRMPLLLLFLTNEMADKRRPPP
jgi:hypothetical protein